MRLWLLTASVVLSLATPCVAASADAMIACIKRNIATLEASAAESGRLAPLEEAAKASPEAYCRFALSKNGMPALARSIAEIKARRADICFGENMADTLAASQKILARFRDKAQASCVEAKIAVPGGVSETIRVALKP